MDPLRIQTGLSFSIQNGSILTSTWFTFPLSFLLIFLGRIMRSLMAGLIELLIYPRSDHTTVKLVLVLQDWRGEISVGRYTTPPSPSSSISRGLQGDYNLITKIAHLIQGNSIFLDHALFTWLPDLQQCLNMWNKLQRVCNYYLLPICWPRWQEHLILLGEPSLENHPTDPGVRYINYNNYLGS